MGLLGDRKSTADGATPPGVVVAEPTLPGLLSKLLAELVVGNAPSTTVLSITLWKEFCVTRPPLVKRCGALLAAPFEACLDGAYPLDACLEGTETGPAIARGSTAMNCALGVPDPEDGARFVPLLHLLTEVFTTGPLLKRLGAELRTSGACPGQTVAEDPHEEGCIPPYPRLRTFGA
mmetsp:Transcript_96438/g.171472  ORF Transcript_96438/g.171472 Transcript_96438/m.171472 type:complete len:177 (+) Transcript_96438:246-776(+)